MIEISITAISILVGIVLALLAVLGIVYWNAYKDLHTTKEVAVGRIRSLEDGITVLLRDHTELSRDYEHRLDTLLKQHERELEKQEQVVRKDSLDRSRSVMRGQATEHLAPLMQSEFHPKDFRFLGDPIDYLIVKGGSDLHDGLVNKVEVYLVDIKTGKSQLSKIQRRIRDAIVAGNIKFACYYPDTFTWEIWDKTGKTKKVENETITEAESTE